MLWIDQVAHAGNDVHSGNVEGLAGHSFLVPLPKRTVEVAHTDTNAADDRGGWGGIWCRRT